MYWDCRVQNAEYRFKSKVKNAKFAESKKSAAFRVCRVQIIVKREVFAK